MGIAGIACGICCAPLLELHISVCSHILLTYHSQGSTIKESGRDRGLAGVINLLVNRNEVLDVGFGGNGVGGCEADRELNFNIHCEVASCCIDYSDGIGVVTSHCQGS